MKYLKYTLFFIISFPIIINAAEIFESKDGKIKYSLEETILSCEYGKPKGKILGIDNDNNYIYGTFELTDLYKVNKDGCFNMNNQEILDFYNKIVPSQLPFLAELKENGKAPVEKFNYFSGIMFIKPEEDYNPDNNIYYTYDPTFGFNEVDNPNINDYDIYYITKDYKFPEKDMTYEEAINSKIDFYKLDVSTSIAVKENLNNFSKENFNILDYRVIPTKSSTSVIKETTYNIDFFDNIKNSDKSTVGRYLKKNDKLYIFLNKFETNNVIDETYESNGKFIGNYVSIFDISDTLLLADKNNRSDEGAYGVSTEIMDYNYNTLFSKMNYGLSFMKYDNYISYLRKEKNYDEYVPYNLFEYKLLSKDNLIYEGNDIKFMFSAPLERVSKIYINDKELDTKNYNKTGNNVTITLKNDYLKNLNKGNYNLKIEYVDGATNDANFKIDFISPPTNDTITNAIIIIVLSLLTVASTIFVLKKESIKSRD